VQRKIRVSLFWSVPAAFLFPTWALANSPMSPIFPALFYVPAILLLLLAVPLAALVIVLRTRWREIGSPNSQKTILHESDFRSIWDIAHLWAGYSRSEDKTELPEPVLDKMQKLIWAFTRKKISLRTRSGNRVPSDDIQLLFFNLNKPRVQLLDMLVQQRFDEAILGSLFVMRSEVLKWCEEDFLTPPTIWAAGAKTGGGAEEQKVVVARHKEEAIDKQLCQAIARTLWDIDSQIHPAHMIKHKAIRRYGNAAAYKDEETIRGWVAEVDPLKAQRKPGRPPAVPYVLDLENGGLNKDWRRDLDAK
jgi:hypothetical protein